MHALYTGNMGSHSHNMSMTYGSVTEVEDLDPEIVIEVNDDDFYVAYSIDPETGRKKRISLPQIYPGEDVEMYTFHINIEQLVALSMIFYERWTFVSGDDLEKQIYEACEEELRKRRKCHPFLTLPQIPAHSHFYGSHSHAGYLPGGHPPRVPPRMQWDIPAN